MRSPRFDPSDDERTVPGRRDRFYPRDRLLCPRLAPCVASVLVACRSGHVAFGVTLECVLPPVGGDHALEDRHVPLHDPAGLQILGRLLRARERRPEYDEPARVAVEPMYRSWAEADARGSPTGEVA